MPSKADLHHFILDQQQQQQQQQQRIATTQDFLARDVDQLVAEIKENLRLRARPCHGAACKQQQQQRPSPYALPASRSAHKDSASSSCHICGSAPHWPRTCPRKVRSHHQQQQASSEAYELLQGLLREGSLIKEAVKRLQMGPNTTKDSNTTTTTTNRTCYYDNDPSSEAHQQQQQQQQQTPILNLVEA